MNDRRRPTGRRAGWGAIAGLAALPVLALGGFAFTSSTSAAQPAEAAGEDVAPIGDDHDLCRGGAVGEVEIALRGGEVIGSGMSQGLRFSLEVTNHSQEDKEVSYAVEVLSVEGRPQDKPTFAAPQLIKSGDRPTTLDFETPRGLPDGYYRVLVTSLTTGAAKDELVNTHEVYIHSRGGAPNVISHDEWYERSGIQRHGRQL